MGRVLLEQIRSVLYVLVLVVVGVDFLSHGANLLHLDVRSLQIGFRGVEYGTPMYELVATVYWGFAFVLLLFAVVLSEVNLEA